MFGMTPFAVGSWLASVGSCTLLVCCDGGGAGVMFGISPALVVPVRSRTSRQTPKVLRIGFPFGVNES